MKRKKKKIVRENAHIIDSKSPFAYNEAYKSLRTNFSFATFDGELQTIIVTSSIPDEGKSSVAINLSKTLAESGLKVLLIDGDLRRPSIGRYLRAKKEVTYGFSNILTGKASYKDVIITHPELGVDVILAGPIPPNASELYARNYVGVLFEELKKIYDFIIIDTPPVGVVTDAAILAKHVDGAIFTVGHKYSKKDIVKKSIETLKNLDVKILGTILNKYDASKDIESISPYSYDYYGYYADLE